MRLLRRVCVFCGSSPGSRPEYARAARATGELLAKQGIGLVYGGGNTGLMGEVADAALGAGGTVIGVIPRHLQVRELAHAGLTELRIVGSMHERKATMADLSDAFLGLPGGLGTIEEFFEMATWNQLGIVDKPLGLLNVLGYFDLVDRFLDHAVAERFVGPEHRRRVRVAGDPANLLLSLRAEAPSLAEKWLDRSER